MCLPISPRPQTSKRKRQAAPGVSEYGVDDGVRTHDRRSHNPVLYQLSYAHHIAFTCTNRNGAPGRTRTCDHPLRRRMLYPTELRALLSAFDQSADFKLRPVKGLPSKAVLPSSKLCSTSGANLNGLPSHRQQPNQKNFSLVKELRESSPVSPLPNGAVVRECASFFSPSRW